jgi:benzoate membrane transport protein
MVFGLFSPIATTLAMALPGMVIGMLGGLAMINVIQNAFVEAFSGRFSFGALVTLLVTISNIELFGIGSAFWRIIVWFCKLVVI